MHLKKQLLAGLAVAGIFWQGVCGEPLPYRNLTEPYEIPLQDALNIGDATVPAAGVFEKNLPPLPVKPGKFLVLRFDAFVEYGKRGGCGYCMELDFTGTQIKRFNADGMERLLGRKPIYHIANDYTVKYKGLDFLLFSGKMIQLFMAPTVESANSHAEEKDGAFFALNISDVARGVDGNTLTVRNIKGTRSIILKNIRIGYLDNRYLPEIPNRVPERPRTGTAVRNDKLELIQAEGGGFTVKSPDGMELIVESAVSMKQEAPPALKFAKGEPGASVPVTVRKNGEDGFAVTARYPQFVLERDLSVTPQGIIEWREKWTNTSNEIQALPFNHRLFLRDEPARFYLAGSDERASLQVCSSNPTMFLESRKHPGRGMGVTLESDWLRLLARLRHNGGVGEIFSRDLALKPGASIDFTMTIEPVEKGGYWDFVNSVRERWGINGGTAERPIFWLVAWEKGKDVKDIIEKSLGHLGPIYFINWGRLDPKQVSGKYYWVGQGYDDNTIILDEYPKLPVNAPRMKGKTPDLDVDRFTTFEHRERFWEWNRDFNKLVHASFPQIGVLMGIHPAIRPVYKPEWKRWPWAGEAIIWHDDEIFNDGYYSNAYLGDKVKKDWISGYFVPRKDTPYYREYLGAVTRVLDWCGSDGLYNDEFSWNGGRAYSRYDYRNWDGYSVTLDDAGKITHFKTDNGKVTEDAQIQVVSKVHKRGKYFLGNGSAGVRGVNDLKAVRFHEGGNGISTWGETHLETVPMLYANFGAARVKMTQENLFKDVKSAIGFGCSYSPTWSNLALKGPDNFVCKLYPLTVMSIGPGTIIGRERLITIQSGSFGWHKKAMRIKLYVYDRNGDLLNRGNLPVMDVAEGEEVKLDVPVDGMVIAELIP